MLAYTEQAKPKKKLGPNSYYIVMEPRWLRRMPIAVFKSHKSALKFTMTKEDGSAYKIVKVPA